MKSLMVRSLTVMAVVCLMMSYSLKAMAAPAGDLLIQAYASLEQADHDYKGRRAEAMKQIEEAGKALGVNIRGDGRGHEKQGVSDAQLRTAQSLLEEARGGLKGKALHHVNKAIKEISIALTIK